MQKDIKEMYQEIFGDAVEQYNAKQKRNDRKIKDYYSKVLKDKKLEPQREFIVQIGDKEDYEKKEDWDTANEILENYVEKFEERNPNLKIYNAVIHNDESTPHLHLNVIPVAEGYKRGLHKQPSFDKALKQQGIEYDKNDSRSLFRNLRNKEINFLETELLDHGIQRKLVGTNAIKDHHQYKELQRELEKMENKYDEELEDYEDLQEEIEEFKEQAEEIANEFNEKMSKKEDEFKNLQGEIKKLNLEKAKNLEIAKDTHIEEFKGYRSKNHDPGEMVLIKRVDFNRLAQQNRSVPSILSENRHLKKENKKLEEEKIERDTKVDDLQEMLEMARKRLNSILRGGSDLWDRCMTYASKFHREGKEIVPRDMLENKNGENDYADWQKKNRAIQMGRFQR